MVSLAASSGSTGGEGAASLLAGHQAGFLGAAALAAVATLAALVLIRGQMSATDIPVG